MKKKKPKLKLVVLKDSRESVSDIYDFRKYKDVQMIRIKLPCGDFSVLGEEFNIFVERKTVNDFCSSFFHGRGRFEEMWIRSMDLQIKYKYFMVEGDFMEILRGEYRSDGVPQSLIASLMSWSLKYKFHWYFVPNIKAGEETVYRLMLNYKRLKKEGLL